MILQELYKISRGLISRKLNEIASEVFEIDIQDEKMIEAAAKAWGDKPLDILVNCAGKSPFLFDDNARADYPRCWSKAC
jgi:short-subunit dehydrogenase